MSEPTPPRTGPLVIYVDDEHANRIVFEQSLLSEFNLVTTADGAAALKLLESEDVAVLVTDMRMPGLSGEELLRIAKEKHPQTIRMVVTAFADVDPILRAINEGLVARYIIKPWQRAEIVQVLRWACEAWTFSRDSAVLHHRLLETERLATLGSITSMVVHDIGQPLLSLMCNLEMMHELAEAAPILSAAVEAMELRPEVTKRLTGLLDGFETLLNDAEKSATYLANLSHGLRALGRPRTADATPTAIDPLPIVRHTLAICQRLAISARASVDYSGPHQLPHVRMSPTELTQVLINVVANGTQAVAARGLPNGRVLIVARANDNILELHIRDDGIGMPPDVLSRAGTPFFTTRAEGTGLGIAQCQRLVGTAGGRFSIVSEHGVGTTVTILLPTAA